MRSVLRGGLLAIDRRGERVEPGDGEILRAVDGVDAGHAQLGIARADAGDFRVRIVQASAIHA